MIRLGFFILGIMLSVQAAYANLNIKEIHSPSGLKAWLVEENSIPMVSLSIGFRTGHIHDSNNKRGATALMTELLDKGAAHMNNFTFKANLEKLASSINFDSNDERITVKATFLSENTDETIALLSAAINQPRFDSTPFKHTKAQFLSYLSQKEKDPDAIATDTFNAVLFGDHPYGRINDGTLETVESLSVVDIRKAHKYALIKDQVYIAAVGDITPQKLTDIIEKLFSSLPTQTKSHIPTITIPPKGTTKIVDFPSPQSIILWGQQGIDFTDRDFFPAYIMNHIIGGSGFTSRLATEIREKRGLTYGIYSYLSNKDHANTIGGSVKTSNENVKEVIDLVQKEWKKMAANGVTIEELDFAKQYITGSYPLRFDSTEKIADLLMYSQMNGFPIDYPSKRNSYINAVNVQDIKRVAKRLLQTSNLNFIIVGQPKDIKTSHK